MEREIKYKGVWTPKAMAEKIMLSHGMSIQDVENMLKAWASDIVEENTPAHAPVHMTDAEIEREGNALAESLLIPSNQFAFSQGSKAGLMRYRTYLIEQQKGK